MSANSVFAAHPKYHHGNHGPLGKKYGYRNDRQFSNSAEGKPKSRSDNFKENITNNSEGSSAVKRLRMHGFKPSHGSFHPSNQPYTEDKNLAQQHREPLLFTESAVIDYVTLKGIENRFGVKKEDIPVSIFKELLDNALDYIESQSTNTIHAEFYPKVGVEISSNDDSISLTVRNPDRKSSLNLKKLNSIFKFKNFSSTKRNQYKISRGAIGNGLKAIVGMSHALATEEYNRDGSPPLKISTGGKLYLIQLTVDKINEKDRPISTKFRSERIPHDDGVYTAVKIDIPTDINSKDKIQNKLRRTFRNYTILNPHITFDITINGKHYSFPQVQNFKLHWNNLDSIYHYSFKEFENLILSSRAYDMTLYDFVSSVRMTESSRLKKEDWNIPIRKVYHDRTIIKRLYDRLKELFAAKEKLDLPYDTRIKCRKEAIIRRLSQWGIKVESIKYQSYNGPSNHDSNGEVQFPIFFVIAEIKTVNYTEGYEVISGINSTIAKLETMENPDMFTWSSKGTDWVDPFINTILKTDCGYSDEIKKFKKADRIVFMHLISPRIDWKGYGKAQIDFKPFSNLGNIIYNTCKGGIRQSVQKKVTQRAILTAYLEQRRIEIKRNSNLIFTDRWTPSDVWYGNRPELLKNGIPISKSTRGNFTALIRVICEEEFHINMEELGIFAADRAQLYFNGHWFDVGFDDLYSLRLKGTDLIIIEKEGMAETMTPLADMKGLAILFTRGFATKYVRDLSELSENAGCNVSVLSDYDDSGILLASKLKVPRIGIDPETLEYFKLKREEVEESYNPKKHLNSIVGLVDEKEFAYLSKKRIEINSVKTKVGTEKLWEWIMHRLKELFPTRNYNRAIAVPSMVIPDGLKEVYTIIEDALKSSIEPKVEQEKEELTDLEGFIDDVPQKRIDIEERLKKVITDNQDYANFIRGLKEYVTSQPFSVKKRKRGVTRSDT